MADQLHKLVEVRCDLGACDSTVLVLVKRANLYGTLDT